MATIQRFEDMLVWQEARRVSQEIYALTSVGSFSKDYELKNQINGSSGSVMDNIAEGFGRGSRAEFKQFLGFSLGSNAEVKSQLYRALDRHHIDSSTFELLYAQVDKITRMLVGLMKYLGRSPYKGVKFMSEDGVDYLTMNNKP